VDLPPHPEYHANFARWRMVRDCFEGEDVVKSRRTLYQPKLSAHKDDEYDAYLRRSYFYNAVRRTTVGLMGSLFRKPPEFDIPKGAGIPRDSITLDGQTLEEFTRQAAQEQILTGRYGILVDFPRRRPNEPVGEPYFAGYAAESLYSWRVRLVKGRKVLDRVVLLEQDVVLTEYGEALVEVVRVLRLDPDESGRLVYSQDVWRWDEEGNAPALERVTPLSLGRSLDYIPFVFLNVTHNLPSVEQSPLYDIASLNIQHYQSTALLQHARFYAGMPTYVTSAGEEGGGGELSGLGDGMKTMSALTVGPSNVWELEKGAKAWILEFNGHGLTFLENAVDSLQLQMQSLGGKLISAQRRAAALSSEAWALLETGDEATLLDVALTLERGLSQALRIMSGMRGDPIPEDARFLVELNKEFVRTDLTARELRAIQSLYERQIIPLDVLYYALREVNVIPIEYSLDDFKKMMDQKDQLYQPPVVETSYAGTSARRAPGAAPAAGGTGTRPASKPPRNDGGGDGQGGQ
jgi:hypothetical protein